MTSIFFETIGSAINTADTEQMQGLLQAADFKITDNLDSADIVIINACCNTAELEIELIQKAKELKSSYKIVLIAGCLAQYQHEKLAEYSLIGIMQIDKVVEIVEEALNNNIAHALSTADLPELNTELVRFNNLIEIIPITRGQINECTYCKTRITQNSLQSYPLEQVMQRANIAINEGVKEIWLTSQDTGLYGIDINTNLPTLLNQVTKIHGNFKIRIGRINPNSLKPIQTELLDCFKSNKLYKFLHLPVESGNNKILESLNLNYTTTDFESQITTFRQKIPEITFMTNITVAFANESAEQFFDTITFLRKTAPEYTNIKISQDRFSQAISKNPEIKNPHNSEIMRRFNVASEVSQNITQLTHEKWLGWEGEITLIKKGRETGHWIGFTPSYTQVTVTGDYKLGQTIDVKIIKIGIFSLIGENIAKKNLKSKENIIKIQVIE